nr:hypothetical protein [Moorella sp. E306M]
MNFSGQHGEQRRVQNLLLQFFQDQTLNNIFANHLGLASMLAFTVIANIIIVPGLIPPGPAVFTYHFKAAKTALYLTSQQVFGDSLIMGPFSWIATPFFNPRLYPVPKFLVNNLRHAAGDADNLIRGLTLTVITLALYFMNSPVKNVYTHILFVTKDIGDRILTECASSFSLKTLSIEFLNNGVITEAFVIHFKDKPYSLSFFFINYIGSGSRVHIVS